MKVVKTPSWLLLPNSSRPSIWILKKIISQKIFGIPLYSKYDLGGIGYGEEHKKVNLTPYCDIYADIMDLDSFIKADCVVEEFYMSHTLEHIPTQEYKTFLEKLYRKLKPGGRVVVIQTDIGAVIHQWIRKELSFRAMKKTVFTPADRLRQNPLNQHQGMWTAEDLCLDFEAMGFSTEVFNGGKWPYDMTDEFYPTEMEQFQGVPIKNLGVIAMKPI